MMPSPFRYIVFRVLGLLMLGMGLLGVAGAQLSTTATITGSVTDATGAVVPGAAVSIKNTATGVVSKSASNADGSFVVPGLNVGTYSVSISKEGFAPYTESGVVLHPAVTATVNGVLKVGGSSTSVTVDAATVQVETATVENSSSVDAAATANLPLNGRNYQGLASLMPGVQNTSAGTSLGTGGRATNNVISVNGLAQSRTFYALDGIWNENTGNMNQTSVVPNPDSLEEVRVLQNNYSARYSLMGSSVVLLQTKSGTRDFHGTAWEFLRNDDLNTKPYFSTGVLPYKQNIFGYNIGGPVFIPKVYNRDRQKTFFFFSEQFVILHQGVASLTGVTPTQDQRNGLFTSPIKNPMTGTVFPQNAAGQYVVSGINPNSSAFLSALYPLPNFGTGAANTTNYINTTPQITNQRDDEIKIDHIFSPRFHLLGEYLDEYQKYAQNSLSGSQSGEIFPVNSETDFTHNKLAQVSLTSILTPNLVNTTSIAMNIFDLDLNLVGVSTIGQIPGFTESLPYNGYIANRIPLVTFSGGTAPQGIAAARPLTHAADLDDTVGTDFSYLRGRHFIQGGFTLVFNTKRQNVGTATNGQFTFTGTTTNPSALINPATNKAYAAVTADDAIADFLLGDAATFTQVSGQPRVAVHGAEFSPYIEDRFKATKNLQITAGVRFYHMPLPYGPPGSETNFVPSVFSLGAAPTVSTGGLITAGTGYNPYNGLVLNGTSTTTGVGGGPTNFSNNHVYYVGPLAGFAWDVFGDGKTSLRGGYGITYTRIFTNQDCSFSCASNPPAFSTVSLSNVAFPAVVGTGSAKPAAIGALTAADQNIQSTQVQSYSLILQREITRDWIASVAGAASTARHVVNTLNINQPLPYQGLDFNPIINTGISPYTYTPAIGSVAASQLSPYPGYGAISELETGQNQNWNALEVSVRHPGKKLFATVAYTYSKDLADTPLDVYHPYKYYGPVSGLDFRHSLSTTAIYSLPAKTNGFVGQLIGGWKLSGIGTVRSGTSLSPALSISNQGIAVRPNRVPSVAIAGPKTKAAWFNQSAFTAPAAGYLGNAGTGIIRGPGLADLDTALYKEFHLTEARYFEFRAEAFNVLNHTSFTTVNTTYNGSTTGTFGTVTAAADPRILEFAAKIHF
jgi:hypothetical protein